MTFDTAAEPMIAATKLPFEKAATLAQSQPKDGPQEQQQQFFDLKLADIRREQAMQQQLQQ